MRKISKLFVNAAVCGLILINVGAVITDSQPLGIPAVDCPRDTLQYLKFLIWFQRFHLADGITLRLDQIHIGVIEVSDGRIFRDLLLQGSFVIIYEVVKAGVTAVINICKGFKHSLLFWGIVFTGLAAELDSFLRIQGNLCLNCVSRQILNISRVDR